MTKTVRRLGGREATTARIDGDFALAVGKPDRLPPDGWKWRLLTDLARLESGHTPSRQRPDFWGGDIPWIGIRDATANHGRTITATNENTNPLGIANSAARVLPANTVCLSRTASVGYVVVMGQPMATSQDFVNWACSEQLDYRFLKYVLMAEGESLLRFASGSVHQTIYFPEVKSFYIATPPMREQSAIAEILGSLDDKIGLNRRMNETLEAMAQAIFRDWFVDFGPTLRKMEGATDPVEIMGGLVIDTDRAQELTGLFPATLGNDGLPEGWSEAPIGEVAEVVGGSTPSTKTEEYWNDGHHIWATPKDLSKLEGLFLFDTERRITDAGLAKIGSGLSPVGTVLLSSRAPIGYLAIADAPTAVNQGFIAIRPSSRLPTSLAFLWCQANMERIKANANGSTFQEISKRNFRPLTIVSGSREIVTEFDNIAAPVFELMRSRSHENRTLVATRDLLLPKLMSGEIRLRDAEREVAA